jgi:hypothetical protein
MNRNFCYSQYFVITLFFGSGKKERAKVSEVSEFIMICASVLRCARKFADKVKEFAVQGKT